MENEKPEIDFDDDRLLYLGTGLIYRCVCAPKSWSSETVEKEVTRVDPPGTIANRWVISNSEDVGPNPSQCPDCDHRQHWTLNC